MVDIVKLDMSKLWAASGDKVTPTDEQLATGWLVQQIPRQTWNWFENRQDQNIAYLLQKGLPEWDNTTEYLANKSYVQRNGVVYKCLTTNTGTDPAVTPANWVKAFPESTASLEAILPLVPAADQIPYFTGAASAALSTLTPFARTLLDDADASTARTTLSAQQSNVNLTAISSVTAGVNALPYFTGTTTAGTTLLTAFARTLLDDADASTARTTLGLGNSSTLNVGTGAGQVAAGNDTRIVEALQRSSNLSELVSPATARTNLGLGTSAVLNVTTSSSDGTTNRLLKTGDFGLGGVGVTLAESGINASNIYSGFYWVLSENAGILPINSGGYLLHLDSPTTGMQQQTYTPYNSTRNFTRQQVSGVWGAWAEEWNSSNTSSDVRTILNAANYAAIRSLLGLANTATAGANSNITSLSGLTTPLSAAQGGTGVTSNTGTGANVLNNSPTLTGTPLAPTAAFGSNSTQIATTAFVQANNGALPVGSLIHFAGPGANAPAGFLLANGAAISRTTYADLYAVLGVWYGAGDGSTTFNLPDARGLFLRGLDNGRGLDVSRVLGAFQANSNKNHTHTGTTASSGNHTHTATSAAAGSHVHNYPRVDLNSGGGQVGIQIANVSSGSLSVTGLVGDHSHSISVVAAGDHTHTFTTGAEGTADESRPDNIAVNIYIKY